MAVLDTDGLRKLWSIISANLAKKVDKADGKQLSTNDFSDSYKSKLDSVESGANVLRWKSVD